MKEWRPSQSQQTQLAPPSNLQEVQNAHTHSWTLRQKLSCDPSSVCEQEIYSSEEEAPA